uniref:NADH-ubiquinone oxidoreductase chain 6 n=1 Tax=Cladosporium sphaerospermum TaxID=92950 RepID=A0A7H1KGK1_CLASH|nr:NADH dehydrogenase subunit 6 [Cladosporium sphaerospermum]QNT26360.1 NADH dehydrogenase subunit 6 [Cladosporium sphaerospermum]
MYLLNETFTNGLNHGLLFFASLASIFCGIFVIVSKNPIVSVLFLIGLFLNIAGYLMLLGINFIGLSYLLVYVGAVSILFLFILMLINVRISELTTDNSNSIPLAIMIGVFFNVTLYKLLPTNLSSIFNVDAYSNMESVNNMSYTTHYTPMSIKDLNTLSSNSDILFVSSHIWDGALAETSHITSIGNIIYTSYPLWLLITSIILLLAMVGAIVITIKQKS